MSDADRIYREIVAENLPSADAAHLAGCAQGRRESVERAQRKALSAYEQGLEHGVADVLDRLIAEPEWIYDEASNEPVAVVRIERLTRLREALQDTSANLGQRDA